MDTVSLLACVMIGSLAIYALSGGADFGGGVWDLLSTGKRADAQRTLIHEAIAPIWEANHVWLILVVVLLFAAFPPAFAAIATALHIPLTLMLVGIVLRGSAFVFRAYGIQDEAAQRRWSRVFAIASTVTPVMLGVTAGAVASGKIALDAETRRVTVDFLSSWLAPFPFAIGFFALALFSFLSAVYLTVEAAEPALQDDFRRRALLSAVAVGGLAAASFALSKDGAPVIWAGLAESGWAIPFHAMTGAAAAGALWTLFKRRFRLARALAMAQVSLILWGWGLAQYPYIVAPDLTFHAAAAPESVTGPILVALIVGAFVLVPSFWYLYRVFKGRSGQRRP